MQSAFKNFRVIGTIMQSLLRIIYKLSFVIILILVASFYTKRKLYLACAIFGGKNHFNKEARYCIWVHVSINSFD